MESPHSALARLSDEELLTEVKRLTAREREATAELIASLVELDERRLYLGAGYSSLFSYCVQALGLSEDGAYFRIEAARAARKYPIILERLASGCLTLTAVKLLAAHLTPDNHRALLDEARGRTRRDVELIVARVAPRPDVPAVVRKLPAAKAIHVPPSHHSVGGAVVAVTSSHNDERTASTATCGSTAPLSELRFLGANGASAPERASAEALQTLSSNQARQTAVDSAPCTPASSPARRPAVVVPLSPERYKIQVTVDAQTHTRLRRLQSLLRHDIPDGDPAAIIDRALTMLLKHVERTKCAGTKRAGGAPKAERASSNGKSVRAVEEAADGASATGRGTGKRKDGGLLDAALRERPGPTVAMDSAAAAASRPPGAERDRTAGENRCDAGREGMRCAELGSERVDGTQQDTAGNHGRQRVAAGRCTRATRSRYIPAAVRRAVWDRDQARCTFVGTDGRCQETGLLEYHHIVPYANGGEATVFNIRLACRRHNGLEADSVFKAEEPPDSRPPDGR